MWLASARSRRQACGVSSPGGSGRIAFICAMPMELRPLVKKLRLEKAEIAGVPDRSGRIGDRDVVAFVTGTGTKLAREGTERLINAVQVDEVAVVGITGAVDDETPIGTLILPEVVVNSATGAEFRPAPRAQGVAKDKMWTTDGLTTDQGELAELRAQGVVSLDMETAAIAELCESRGIPWSVFRVISDRATDGSINEEVFHLSNQDGTPNKQAVARYFLKHPTHVARMAELAKGAKLATETSASAAISSLQFRPQCLARSCVRLIQVLVCAHHPIIRCKIQARGIISGGKGIGIPRTADRLAIHPVCMGIRQCSCGVDKHISVSVGLNLVASSAGQLAEEGTYRLTKRRLRSCEVRVGGTGKRSNGRKGADLRLVLLEGC